MIKTCGLTHIHLVVKDVQQSLDFYQTVFGMQERFWVGDDLVFLNTPGSNDVIALHQSTGGELTGASGGILHFGFQLHNKSELDDAINEVIAAGGSLKKRGEFAPGIRFAYVADPDDTRLNCELATSAFTFLCNNKRETENCGESDESQKRW